MILRFLIAIALTLALFNPNIAHADAERRILVVVRADAKAKDWVRDLPAGARLVRVLHPFYLVELKRPLAKSQKDKLLANPVVKRVHQDKVVRHDDLLAGGRCDARAETTDAIGELIQALDPACPLTPKCQCQGSTACEAYRQRPALSAQLAMGGDLMLDELERIGPVREHTAIAVLDSGFAPAVQDYMASPLTWVRDFTGNDARMTDDNGHGTAVAGVIGGRGGVGLAPSARIGFYKINDGADTSSTKAATAIMAVLDACRAGYKIINLSYASIDPDKDNPEAMAELADNGCMVFKSAGNTRTSGASDTDPLDAWLRVGGVHSETLDLGGFHPGEISAPGRAVPTLASSADPTCMGMPMVTQDGSSLAAPLAAAVAYNVRGVLARDASFNALPGAEQIRVIARVLQGSERGGILNGLAAVLLAEQWTKAPPGAKPAGALTLETPARCDTSPAANPKLDELECGARQRAFRDLRFRLAVCANFPASSVREAAAGLARLGEIDFARNTALRLPGDEDLTRLIAREDTRFKLQALAETERLRRRDRLENARQNSLIALDQYRQIDLDRVTPQTLAEIRSSLNSAFESAREELAATEREFNPEPGSLAALFAHPDSEEGREALAAAQAKFACAQAWKTGFARLPAQITPERLHAVAQTTARAHPNCRLTREMLPHGGRTLIMGAAQGLTLDEIRAALAASIAEEERRLQVFENALAEL